MSLRLNLYYAIHNVQDSFVIMLFVLVYARVVILLTFGKHVHHNIMSLSGEAWALVPFIEVPVPSHESQRSVAVPSQQSQRSVAVPSQESQRSVAVPSQESQRSVAVPS